MHLRQDFAISIECKNRVLITYTISFGKQGKRAFAIGPERSYNYSPERPWPCKKEGFRGWCILSSSLQKHCCGLLQATYPSYQNHYTLLSYVNHFDWMQLQLSCPLNLRFMTVTNFVEEKQHKHKLSGPDFLRTFLTLTPRMGSKSFSPSQGRRKTPLLGCGHPRFSAADVHDPKGSRKTLYKKTLY